jgi:hypothetical protein
MEGQSRAKQGKQPEQQFWQQALGAHLARHITVEDCGSTLDSAVKTIIRDPDPCSSSRHTPNWALLCFTARPMAMVRVTGRCPGRALDKTRVTMRLVAWKRGDEHSPQPRELRRRRRTAKVGGVKGTPTAAVEAAGE